MMMVLHIVMEIVAFYAVAQLPARWLPRKFISVNMVPLLTLSVIFLFNFDGIGWNSSTLAALINAVCFPSKIYLLLVFLPWTYFSNLIGVLIFYSCTMMTADIKETIRTLFLGVRSPANVSYEIDQFMDANCPDIRLSQTNPGMEHSLLPLGARSCITFDYYWRRERDVRANKQTPFREITVKRPHLYYVPINSKMAKEFKTWYEIAIDAQETISTSNTNVIIICEEIYLDAYDRFLMLSATRDDSSFQSILRMMYNSSNYNLPRGMGSIIYDSIKYAHYEASIFLAQREPFFNHSNLLFSYYSMITQQSKERFVRRLVARRLHSNTNDTFLIVFLRCFLGPIVRIVFPRLGKRLFGDYSDLIIELGRLACQRFPTYNIIFKMFTQKISDSEILSRLPPAVQKIVPKTYGYLYKELPELWRATSLPETNASVPLTYFNDNSVHPVSWSFFSKVAYANPTPDFRNVDNLVDAINYRINHKLPFDSALMTDLKDFARNEINKLPILDQIPTFHDWLNSTKYSLKKKELIDRIDRFGRYTENSMFVKNESYTKFKSPRAIFNVSQNYKNLEGPVVAAAESIFHDFPEVLTGKPVREWGKIVCDSFSQMGDYDTYVTDYSSYECSFGPELKDAVENQFYSHILRKFPKIANKMRQVQNSKRKVVKYTPYGKLEYSRTGGRFSGDQRTYQANTLANIYINRFILSHLNVPYRFFVSGDDGIIALPKGTDIQPILRMYADLGLKLKLEPTTVEMSDFCGFTFNSERSYSRLARDPVKIALNLLNSSVLMSHKKNFAYLRDKVLCLLYEFPTDPILAPFARKILPKLNHRARVPRDFWTEMILDDVDETLPDILKQPLDDISTSARITGLSAEFCIELRESLNYFADTLDSQPFIDLVAREDFLANNDRFKFNLYLQ